MSASRLFSGRFASLLLPFLFPFLFVLIVLSIHGQWPLLAHLLYVSFIALLYTLSIYGWGSTLNRFAKLSEPNDTAMQVAGSFISGLALLDVVFLVLNVTGIFRPYLVICILSGGAIQSFFFLPKIQPAEEEEGDSKIDRFLPSVLAFLIGIQIVLSWTPLIFYDAIQYHFLAPLRYLQHGGFVYIPLNFSTNMPLAIQLIFGSSAAFDPSGEAFKMIATIFGTGLIGAAALLVKREGAKPGMIAAFAVLGFSGFWLAQTLGVIDLTIGAVLVAGACFFYDALTRSPKSIWIAAFSFGLVLGSRYPGVLLTGIVVLSFSIHSLLSGRIGIRTLVSQLLICGLVIFVMVTPWLVKNFMFTGNPVYPLFQKQLDGFQWSAHDSEILRGDTVGDRFHGLTPFLKFAYLFRLLWSNGPIGILILICSAAVLFKFPIRSYPWLLCITGWAGILAWGWIHPLGGTNLVRFNAGSVLLLIASMAILVAPFRSVRILLIILSLACSALAARSVNQLLSAYETLTDQSARQNLVRANVPSWDVIQYTNTHLNAGTKVFFLGETRSFFLKTPSYASDAYHGTELAQIFQPPGNPQSWFHNLQGSGITHILLSVPELNRLQKKSYLPLSKEHLAELAGWLRGMPLIYADGQGTFLFELRDAKKSAGQSER